MYKRMVLFCMALLTVFALTACGDTTAVSSAPEGLQTFGTSVDPSAQPSTGQTAPNTMPAVSQNQPGTSAGALVEGDTTVSQKPTASPASSATPSTGGSSSTSTPAPTAKPSTTATPSSSASPSPSATASPAISPPAPASTATRSEVEAYIGKTVSELIAAVGYPQSADYQYVDEDDHSKGEIGTLYFDGFTVTTRRDEDGDIITAVSED